jgi:hypothetical protein
MHFVAIMSNKRIYGRAACSRKNVTQNRCHMTHQRAKDELQSSAQRAYNECTVDT